MSGMISAGGQAGQAASRPGRRFAAALPALLLALGACAPEPSPPAEADKADVRVEPPAKVLPAPAPDAGEDAGQPTAAPRPAAATGERRCGWLHNPTPGNWWLFDGHGEWILATQGGYRAAGMDDIPDMTGMGWVELNGHYGYGCACMIITADPGTLMVTRIDSPKPQPLKQCRADRALPQP